MRSKSKRAPTSSPITSQITSKIASKIASRTSQKTASKTGSKTSPTKAIPRQPKANALQPREPKAFALRSKLRGQVKILSSEVAFRGPLFTVETDHVQEPGGIKARRDVIRHSGSVVILAVDESENPNDPIIILERQYRHAAGLYLWEIPAGRKEPAEKPLAAAKRELIEETGYRARSWSKLLRYFASPGFLGEWMEVYLAQGITLGDAQPEEDEYIQIERVPLSHILELIYAGKIQDGKTIISVLQYHALRTSRNSHSNR